MKLLTSEKIQYILVIAWICSTKVIYSESKNLKVLLGTVCSKGHLNPNAAIARALLAKGHEVDIILMDDCVKETESRVPNANNIIVTKTAQMPPGGIDPKSGISMILSAKEKMVDKWTYDTHVEMKRQLERKEYDVVVAGHITLGLALGAKIKGVPFVVSIIGAVSLTYKEDEENWDFVSLMPVPKTLPEPVRKFITCFFAAGTYYTWNRPMFQLVRREYEINKLPELTDENNDGNMPWSYYYRNTINILQGPPDMVVSNVSRIQDDDNMYFYGFVPDKSLYPSLKEGDLLQFIEESQKPLIYISMGTVTNFGLEWHIEKLKEFENQSKYSFVWAVYPDHEEKLKAIQKGKDSVFIGSYLPQGSILMHHKTKVFVTHCGANSIQDSIYATKPMLGFPSFGDQPAQADRLEQRGMGLRLNSLTMKELDEKLTFMLREDVYNQIMETLTRSKALMVGMGGYERAVEIIENAAAGKIKVKDVSKNLGSNWPAIFLISVTIPSVIVIFLVLSLCCLVRCCKTGAKGKIE